jgi:hypothetical protein
VGIAVATIVASTETMKTAKHAAKKIMRAKPFAFARSCYFRTMSSVTSTLVPITGSSRDTAM